MLSKPRHHPTSSSIPPNHTSRTSNSSSKFWYFLYGFIGIWFIFLLSFHYLSLEPFALTADTPPAAAGAVAVAVAPTSLSQSDPKTTKKPFTPTNPSINRPATSDSSSKEEDEEKMHIVFSTDCSFFQDWQTLLVFHSAIQIQQKGKITRIASGCSSTKQTELLQLYATLFPSYSPPPPPPTPSQPQPQPQTTTTSFSVHFTPDFKMDNKTKKKYDFYNKPYGLHHWLVHANPPIEKDTVVILIDPDMILLRPFTLQFKKNPLNLFMKGYEVEKEKIPEKIGKGHPVAQLYGLGAPWATERSKNFNRKEVCGEGSPCLSVTTRFGELHYSVGPPYLLEKDDLLRLTESWTQFVPKVYTKYPALLAEMYAYSMAAAHQNLPHITMIHYMISNVDMPEEEGWKYIDVLEDNVCEEPVNGIFYPNQLLPNVLHFCQFYRSGNYGFQKRRIRQSLFACEKPMMAHLPADLGKNRFKNRDGEIIKMGAKQSRRNSFMLCTIHRAINAMVRYYKSKMCNQVGVPVNYTESINLVELTY